MTAVCPFRTSPTVEFCSVGLHDYFGAHRTPLQGTCLQQIAAAGDLDEDLFQ